MRHVCAGNLAVLPAERGCLRLSGVVHNRFSWFIVVLLCSCSEAHHAPEGEHGEQGDAHERESGARADVCEGRASALRGDLVGLELPSERGKTLQLVATAPRPPGVGDNTWTVEIEEGGTPLVGLAERMEVTPFMPDHGHGTAVAVEVSEVAPGSYEWSPINLRMPGYWLVTATLAEESGSSEDADLVQLGLCVE